MNFFLWLRMFSSSRLWPATFVLIAIQFVFVFVYLGHEHNVAFWDYAMYANMALSAWASPSWESFWSYFTGSFAQNYNLLFSLPSFLSFPLFGATRDVFILTNFAVFFIAHQLSIGFVLSKTFDLSLRRGFLWSLALCPALPFLWYPLLEGYPDNGAAALFILALGLLLPENSTRLKHALLVGVLCGLSIVFRRHYAYPVMAVLLAHGLWSLFFFFRSKSDEIGLFIKRSFVFYGTCLTGLVLVLVGFEPAYLQIILATNYQSLYKSYERPASYFLLFTLSRVGLGLCALTLAGYVLAIKNKKPRNLMFVFFVTFVWVILWARGPSQAGEHYLISILPCLCAIGLFGLFQSLLANKRHRSILGLIIGLLAINSAYSFWLAPRFVAPNEPPRLSLFSAQRPPWVRTDMKELSSLASYLKETTTHKDKIVFVGSSFIFNQDLMRAEYTDVLQDISVLQRFVFAPESDGQQDPPLQAFALGNVYVVATPTQYHLDPSNQKVVAALADRFPPAPEDAFLFEKDARSFLLEKDVRVEIWRRKSWVPHVLHANLKKIRKYKGSLLNWIPIETNGATYAETATDNQSSLILRHPVANGQTTLFFDPPLGKGRYRLSAEIAKSASCRDVLLQAFLMNPEGTTILKKESSIFFQQGLISVPFTNTNEAETFLKIALHTKTDSVCTVALKQLRIEQIQ